MTSISGASERVQANMLIRIESFAKHITAWWHYICEPACINSFVENKTEIEIGKKNGWQS